MPGKETAQFKDQLIRDLTQRAISLFGEERARALGKMIEETAEHSLAITKKLPHFEEVPTLTWHNHP